MTKEEAIRVLGNLKLYHDDDNDILEALGMAIKALQRQNYSPNSKSVFELMKEGEENGH